MSKDQLAGFIGHWLPKLEDEMRAVLRYPAHSYDEQAVAVHYGMMQYHMGWLDEHLQPDKLPTGKRLRPILCLLACMEVGGEPANALPAAAAIELLHNFSLIHDDVEDGDEVRRHRPTVWKLWGVPQAINAGDGLFTLAFAAMQRLQRRGVSAQATLAALELFTHTCVELTEGQHLDMRFEQRVTVQTPEYMRMIEGKTASLIGAAVAIGALIGGATDAQDQALQRFGQAMGLAFQIQDDILGIWGDPAVTGKAAGNDILRRKKSLPLLYALNHETVGPQLQALWQEDLGAEQLPLVLQLLAETNARQFPQEQFDHHHHVGIAALHDALGDRAASSALLALANSLLHRES